jgi:hypothetical protein
MLTSRHRPQGQEVLMKNVQRAGRGLVGLVVAGALTVGVATSATAGTKPKPKVIKGSGDVTELVEAFRNHLGTDNGGEPASYPSGRREINWDAVPDEYASPNALPGDLFNGPAAPLARGAVLETPGEHVAVSADAENAAGAAVRFGDLNPSYVETFSTFSDERLFSPVGSNVANIRFYVPGTTTPAGVRGFGAVYTDVDRKEGAAFEFFDTDGKKLGTYAVPKSKDGLSFLGVAYKKANVGRVRIVYGTDALGPDDSEQYDVAVMDDFIFGEPQAVKG